MMLEVEIRHQHAGFALDVAFRALPGVTVLFGRSGSGKTSVINAVSGLFQPEQALIRLDEQDLSALPVHKRRLGYIFQEGRLFPHLTVRQNLRYGAWFADRDGEVEEPGIVEMLGIGPLLERRPQALSGGEKQRVAIGRALLSNPRMLLADEPLAALDEPRKAEILPYFERLRDELRIPILYVSHSAAEVARLATTVVVLQNGRVAAQGTASEVLGDPDVAPAGIRSVGAVLTARVMQHHADGLTELEAGEQALFLPKVAHAPGTALRVRIPAQDVILSRTRPEGLSALNILQGRISAIRSGGGPGVLVSVKTQAGTVLARITRRSAQMMEIGEDQEIWAVVKTVSIAPSDIGGP